MYKNKEKRIPQIKSNLKIVPLTADSQALYWQMEKAA